MSFRLSIVLALSGLVLGGVVSGYGSSPAPDAFFEQGVQACHVADFARATETFRRSLEKQPASGTLLNLGIAEWRRGHAGQAILAWEQALWLDPYDGTARSNLDFARSVVQLDKPDLRWYEVASTWLAPSAWAWIASGSLWLAVAMMILPRVRRWRKTGWHQGLAALGLGVFLLSVPTLIGMAMRSRIGIVLDRNVPLRLTPTEEAESISSLVEGETARQIRTKGNFVLVRALRDSGWIKREQFGLICPRSE